MLRYQEIKLQLKQIASSMHPGDKLPSRPALCKSLDTTRATLEKAVKELIAEQVLTAHNGSGTYVAGAPLQPEEIKTIGLVLPNNTIASYRMLISSVEAYMQDKGVNVVLCNTDGDVTRQNQYISRLLQSKVAGIIIVPVLLLDATQNYLLYSRLMQHSIPVVFCYRGIDGLNAPLVTYNNFYGGYAATKHLIQMGYRRIAYISQVYLRTSIDRFQGYMAALEEHGLPIDRDLVVLGTDRVYQEASRMVSIPERADGIFCQTDKISPEVYRAITDHGLRVSKDVGVIGYDDLDICLSLSPRLTTLGGKDQQMGTRAAALIWKSISGEEMRHFPYYVFQPEIVRRASCLGPEVV